MEVQDKHHRVSFASVSGKPVEAVFDGGVLTSDIELMLLREVESKIGILSRIVEALTDRRHPKLLDCGGTSGLTDLSSSLPTS